jgi:2-keto-3-deoxy-L-rhamnonate aldolase RhmA
VKPNTTLRALRAGKTVLGAETSSFYPGVPLLYADAGLDFIWIDLEHTLMGLDRVGVVIEHARLAGITPVVRVPELQPGLVRRLLDNGAQGVILPQVETPEEVSEVISWCLFRPDGRRGVGSPDLANDFTNVALADHVRQSGDEVLVVVQIESKAGVDRIEEIVGVERLDLVCLGLADLSISLGVPGDVDDPLVVAAAEHVFAAAAARCVACGVAGFYGRSYEEPSLVTWHRRGARFFQLFGDLGVLGQTVRSLVAESRQHLEGIRPDGS